MQREEAKDAPNLVTGTFSIKIQLVDVLFDSGAMHSFILSKLVETLGLVPTSRPSVLSVALLDGKNVRCDELHKDYPIQIDDHKFLVDLYKFELTDFTVTLGMDWLSRYLARINYPK